MKLRAFCFTGDKVKAKWKYVREQFRRELAKQGKPRSGDAAGVKVESNWKYFKELLFLKDQFTPRQTTSNLKIATPNSPESQIEETEIDLDSPILSPESEDIGTETPTTPTPSNLSTLSPTSSTVATKTPASLGSEPKVIIPSRKRLRQGELIGTALLNIERDKMKLLQEKRANKEIPLDEDRHFFESLIPHIKKMDPVTKLQFRSKVQDLVIDYSYNRPSTLSSRYYTNPIASTSSSDPTPQIASDSHSIAGQIVGDSSNPMQEQEWPEFVEL